MGTLSTITFYEVREDELLPMVRVLQVYDGYIGGVGHELAEWLLNKRIVNGIKDYSDRKSANGYGDLVAQYIRDHKPIIGDLYIDTFEDSLYDVEYNYEVYFENKYPLNPQEHSLDEMITIEVRNLGMDELIFHGSPSELLKFSDDDEEDDDE